MYKDWTQYLKDRDLKVQMELWKINCMLVTKCIPNTSWHRETQSKKEWKRYTSQILNKRRLGMQT